MFPIILTAFLAIYVAWNLGANDVANSMGTSVGSKAITLRKALLIAGILEFTGALLFGQGVASTLATKVTNPVLFADHPQTLLLGMVAVLISCGLWLQIATWQGLPVASSHAVVGAIAGFSGVAVGTSAIDWQNIGLICLGWLITPLISGVVAALFYSVVRRWILEQKDSLTQLREWIPWLSAILLGVFGVIVLPTVFNRPIFNSFSLPSHTLSLAVGGMAALAVTNACWNRLERLQKGVQEVYSQKQERQALEKVLGGFQVLSACFVAFAHGSNDVGNAIAPLAVVVFILTTGSVPLHDLIIPTWILVLGGLGIVAGLSVQGKNVITTVGEDIIPLQPSSGFSAEIATATTILLASRFGFPVSTSHALVGAVVGIGLIQKGQNVKVETVKSVILAWVVTLPVTALIGGVIFAVLRFFFNE